MLRVAGRTVELGMTLLHCFATPFGVGSTVLLSNVITLLLKWKCMLLFVMSIACFCDFCDAYSFWMSSGMLSVAWACRLLSGASAIPPASQLIIRQNF